MSHCDMSKSRPRRRSSRRWPWSQHAPSPTWGPQTGDRHTARTGTTHGHQRPAARPPPYDFIEFRPPLPTQPPPSTTRLESPQTHRARVLHARNASVTLAIRHLGMKTRRTSYRTALGALIRLVSYFWSEGAKRQPGGPPSLTSIAHRNRAVIDGAAACTKRTPRAITSNKKRSMARIQFS